MALRSSAWGGAYARTLRPDSARVSGASREWAREQPSVFNYLARNFMPYTHLGLGLTVLGLSPPWHRR